MEIPKAQILDMPKQRGDDGQAAQADQELPDRVDPERDSGLLARQVRHRPAGPAEQARGGGIPGL